MKSSGPVENIHLLRNAIWIFFFAETCAGVNFFRGNVCVLMNNLLFRIICTQHTHRSEKSDWLSSLL
jgi:hypothetical protein